MAFSLNSSKSLAVAMLIAMFGSSHAVASVLPFSGTASGSWSVTQGTTGIDVRNNDSGENSGDPDRTADVAWGTPGKNFPGRNLWSFNGVGSDGGAGWSADTHEIFRLGDFSYFNGSVHSHDFRSADLAVSLNIAGLSIDPVFNFGFDVINTLNDCVGLNCSDDRASISNTISNQVFEYGGQNYTLMLLGFSQDGGTSLFQEFNVAEGVSGSASLYGKIALAPVPLPAAGWLLLAGIGGLGLMRRRQARHAA